MIQVLVATVLAAACGATPDVRFDAARPVWPAGYETQRNAFVGFRAVVEAPPHARACVLRVTGSSFYRAFVNGTFVGWGPARGPHGWFRVDEWDLRPHLRAGRNVVAIEAVAYNVDCFCVARHPGFLQAEVASGGDVLAATGHPERPFDATILTQRVRKVPRYSSQRPFGEAYRMSPRADDWRSDPYAAFETVTVAVGDQTKLLPRGVPYPRFRRRGPATTFAPQTVSIGEPATDERRRAIAARGLPRGGFAPEDIEVNAPADFLRVRPVGPAVPNMRPEAPHTLARNTSMLVDFGVERTGFIGLSVEAAQSVRLYLTFDEILTDGHVDPLRGGVHNVVYYELEPGTYALESFEPYTFRYLRVTALDGECRLQDVYLREYANPDVWEAAFAASDDRLNRLFEAARNTFRQNAPDIFMDCPGRERAGWLCDSFFTARTAFDLCGDTRVERNFIENYRLAPSFETLPDGMLPMCYPADHIANRFIPNWAMWFVVQLDAYVARSGDRAMIDALRPKVEKLLAYFERFENGDGLLEKLESWVFVEWSAANKFVQDVNYPTNMLYAATLDAAGRLYGRQDWRDKAERLRATIRAQSFDGEFFVDNAQRSEDGKLARTTNRTETCQYYAFYFGIATPESHPKLWRRMASAFGPGRPADAVYPDVPPSNTFIGSVLRLELLSRDGRSQQVVDETIAYFLYMAERTGTLWENMTPHASCNHGFASHVAHVLYRDALGVRTLDPIGKRVVVRPGGVDLDWCRGRLPTPDGAVNLAWRRAGATVRYHVDVPDRYVVEVEGVDGISAERE
jgi:alpha-L-rhamnosidase